MTAAGTDAAVAKLPDQASVFVVRSTTYTWPFVPTITSRLPSATVGVSTRPSPTGTGSVVVQPAGGQAPSASWWVTSVASNSSSTDVPSELSVPPTLWNGPSGGKAGPHVVVRLPVAQPGVTSSTSVASWPLPAALTGSGKHSRGSVMLATYDHVVTTLEPAVRASVMPHAEKPPRLDRSGPPAPAESTISPVDMLRPQITHVRPGDGTHRRLPAAAIPENPGSAALVHRSAPVAASSARAVPDVRR